MENLNKVRKLDKKVRKLESENLSLKTKVAELEKTILSQKNEMNE